MSAALSASRRNLRALQQVIRGIRGFSTGFVKQHLHISLAIETATNGVDSLGGPRSVAATYEGRDRARPSLMQIKPFNCRSNRRAHSAAADSRRGRNCGRGSGGGFAKRKPRVAAACRASRPIGKREPRASARASERSPKPRSAPQPRNGAGPSFPRAVPQLRNGSGPRFPRTARTATNAL